MPLGTEQALVGAVSAAAVVIGAVFAGIWWNVGDPSGSRLTATVVSPAPFHATFCDHLIAPKNGQHQVIVRVNPLPETPPPPPEGILVQASFGARVVGTDTTDIFGCATVDVPRAQTYVFEASVKETDDNATHRWWSNALTTYYDGESPGYVEVRLNNYARYGTT